MTDRDALYQAICANPDEDTPRLAFADYLEEEGGKENTFRAAYIRGAIRVAREDLYSPAWVAANQAWGKSRGEVQRRISNGILEWVKPLKGRAKVYEFDRGFVGHITVYSKRFVAEGNKFFEQFPIRSVKFVTLMAGSGTVSASELFACPHLARVLKLNLEGSGLREGDLNLMIGSKHLANVQSIGLSGYQRFRPPALMKLLKALPSLTELRFPWSMHFTDVFATALANSKEFVKLESLDLHGHTLSSKGVIALLTSKHAKNLKELRIAAGYTLDDEHDIYSDVRRLTAKECAAVHAKVSECKFPNLRYLDLSGYHLTDEALLAIATSGGFPSLRQLIVEDNKLTEKGLRAFADSPLGKQLVCFYFSNIAPEMGKQDKLLDAAKAMFPNANLMRYRQW